MGRERTSRVPWHIEQMDLRAANDGHIEFTRDVLVDGKAERQIALHVVGQFNRGLSLGLIAIRCQRHGGWVIPLTMAIPDTVVVPADRPAMDMTLLSGPQRVDDNGANEPDEDSA